VLKLTDAEGRVFALRRITLADYDALAALGLDVEAVSEDLSRLADVIQNRRKFAGLLWWFVGPAVEAAKLTPAEFHAGLDGDAIYRAATGVRDAVIDFFPYPPEVKAKFIASLAPPAEPTAPGGSGGGPTSWLPSPDSTPGG
jgi:hypothetical protein